MSQTYMARRRAQARAAEQKPHTNAPGPSLSELAAGAMPSTEQMGHRVDLPDAIREKMEASFGADFSGVKVYESQTVADAGAQAMTMGSNVAFAPGKLDLASTSGQALLGHELSHVVSQARGESAGQGFLADSGLEAQADRQGALAAQGESVYTGPVTPLSASAVPASAGPLQAAGKTVDDDDREQLALNDAAENQEGMVTTANLPSRFHFIKRRRSLDQLRQQRAARLAAMSPPPQEPESLLEPEPPVTEAEPLAPAPEPVPEPEPAPAPPVTEPEPPVTEAEPPAAEPAPPVTEAEPPAAEAVPAPEPEPVSAPAPAPEPAPRRAPSLRDFETRRDRISRLRRQNAVQGWREEQDRALEEKLEGLGLRRGEPDLPLDKREQAIEAYLSGGMRVHRGKEWERMFEDIHPSKQGKDSEKKLLQYVVWDIRNFLDTDIRDLNAENDETVKNAHGQLSGIGSMMEGIQAVLPFLPKEELKAMLGKGRGIRKNNKLLKFKRKAKRFRKAMAGAQTTVDLLDGEHGEANEEALSAERAAREKRRNRAQSKRYSKG